MIKGQEVKKSEDQGREDKAGESDGNNITFNINGRFFKFIK